MCHHLHACIPTLCVQDEECTPIKQDIKKGNLRFYPYNINWNYGLLPQVRALRLDVQELGSYACKLNGAALRVQIRTLT